MKKLLTLVVALAALAGRAHADGLAVEDFAVPQGGTATFSIELNNGTTAYAAFQFDIVLTDGISVAVNEKGKLVYEKGARFDGEAFTLSLSNPETDLYRALGYYTETSAIPGSSGTIVSVTVEAGGGLAVGSTCECRLTAINLTEPDETKHELEDVTFTVTIGEPADTRTVLDEASIVAPEAATGVDVRVKRTIRADEWSTICLPFAMTEAQVQAAFGSDVQLADFTGYEVEEDGDGNVVGLSVDFSDVDAIEANHPYLIKVSAAVSEFTVDGVDVDPEEEPTVATVKRTRKQWSEFIGTYAANTAVPEKTLFLSGNKFYYSTGATKMKAFRGYFDFYDVLTEVDESYAKVRFFIDDTAAEIEGIGGVMQTGAVYSVSGVRMGTADRLKTLPKGLYIVNGKKVYNQ